MARRSARCAPPQSARQACRGVADQRPGLRRNEYLEESTQRIAGPRLEQIADSLHRQQNAAVATIAAVPPASQATAICAAADTIAAATSRHSRAARNTADRGGAPVRLETGSRAQRRAGTVRPRLERDGRRRSRDQRQHRHCPFRMVEYRPGNATAAAIASPAIRVQSIAAAPQPVAQRRV